MRSEEGHDIPISAFKSPLQVDELVLKVSLKLVEATGGKLAHETVSHRVSVDQAQVLEGRKMDVELKLLELAPRFQTVHGLEDALYELWRVAVSATLPRSPAFAEHDSTTVLGWRTTN